MDFKDMTVGEFARGIGAELPVAGGGSAAALSGAYGCLLYTSLLRYLFRYKAAQILVRDK